MYWQPPPHVIRVRRACNIFIVAKGGKMSVGGRAHTPAIRYAIIASRLPDRADICQG